MVTDAREATLALLAARAAEATICPSEVARVLAAAASPAAPTAAWREMVPAVHAAVDLLVADGIVRLSWKGRKLEARAGPYRIGRDARDGR
ncbi:MAG TPA: DUF3253 domain-containing protein [Sphingomonas sp.]|nr:DUF3253 domain-containing protein [Sphingomonas sp.]